MMNHTNTLCSELHEARSLRQAVATRTLGRFRVWQELRPSEALARAERLEAQAHRRRRDR